MRIVFFGTPDLAVPSIEALHAAYGVQALVCQPDRPKGRGRRVEPPPAKVCAERLGIPVHQPEKLNDGAFETWLREMSPDLCAVAAYGRMLKQPLLDVPPLGFLNLHPSLLPKYRGASPIQTALLNGDTVTGVTIMRIILEMDAGDILLQEEAAIFGEDTSESLSERLAAQGAALFTRAVGLVASGEAVFTPQDPARAVACRKFEKEDGLIRWERPATELHNLVHAAIPWPVAHTTLRGTPIRVHRTRVVDEEFADEASSLISASSACSPTGSRPSARDVACRMRLEASSTSAGTVLSAGKDGIVVATGRGALVLLSVQAPGKRVMTADEYLRGNPVEPGDRLGEP